MSTSYDRCYALRRLILEALKETTQRLAAQGDAAAVSYALIALSEAWFEIDKLCQVVASEPPT